jgi:hypothetical protein
VERGTELTTYAATAAHRRATGHQHPQYVISALAHVAQSRRTGASSLGKVQTDPQGGITSRLRLPECGGRTDPSKSDAGERALDSSR